APNRDACLRLIAPVEDEVRRILGPALWGVDNETLPTVVGKELMDRRLTVATMESCTGGMLAGAFTEAEGSSDYYRGGLVTYATDQKELEGVDPALIEEHGVISTQVAIDMARAVRERMKADVRIGITGVAGPATIEDKPVRSAHIGIDMPGRREVMT